MKSLIFVPVLFSLFISCNQPPGVDDKTSGENSESASGNHAIDTLSDSTEKTNIVDQNGLKQGKHIQTNSNGTIIKVENFQNDTLNGYYFNWSGMKEEGNMNAGKRDGLFFQYYNKNQILYIRNYAMDSLLYFAPYAANQSVVVPHKDIKVYADSLYLNVHHPDGNIWYEGLFLDGKEVGIHKVHFESGKLHGIINFDLGTYEEFDSTGTKIIESKKIPVPVRT